MTSLEIIKDELAKIDEARAKALKGQYEYDYGRGIRENACGWLEYESFATNEITKLTKALSVAVEALSGYQEGCMVDKKFIPNDAMSAINTIANILRSASVSGSKDGK